MGVGAGLYMYVVVVQKFTFAISSPDEFLSIVRAVTNLQYALSWQFLYILDSSARIVMRSQPRG